MTAPKKRKTPIAVSVREAARPGTEMLVESGSRGEKERTLMR